jgi:hypothetical protein
MVLLTGDHPLPRLFSIVPRNPQSENTIIQTWKRIIFVCYIFYVTPLSAVDNRTYLHNVPSDFGLSGRYDFNGELVLARLNRVEVDIPAASIFMIKNYGGLLSSKMEAAMITEISIFCSHPNQIKR